MHSPAFPEGYIPLSQALPKEQVEALGAKGEKAGTYAPRVHPKFYANEAWCVSRFFDELRTSVLTRSQVHACPHRHLRDPPVSPPHARPPATEPSSRTLVQAPRIPSRRSRESRRSEKSGSRRLTGSAGPNQV